MGARRPGLAAQILTWRRRTAPRPDPPAEQALEWLQGLRSCIDGADRVKRRGVGSVRAAHDRPGCAGSWQVRARGIYLRQVDIPGVDTKFIGARKRLIAELLDQVLPAESIDAGAVGARQLETRYGLLGKPAQNARCKRIGMD